MHKAKKNENYDEVGNIIAYESGQLDEEGIIKLFQHLLDSGKVWHLQGHYGRTANAMLEAGLLEPPEKTHKDYYGHTVDYSKYKKKK